MPFNWRQATHVSKFQLLLYWQLADIGLNVERLRNGVEHLADILEHVLGIAGDVIEVPLLCH